MHEQNVQITTLLLVGSELEQQIRFFANEEHTYEPLCLVYISTFTIVQHSVEHEQKTPGLGTFPACHMKEAEPTIQSSDTLQLC